MVRVKVGDGVIVIVIVIGLGLMRIMHHLCAFIPLCLKRSNEISRLRTGNGEYRKGYKIQRVKKFNNIIRMVR